MVICTLSEGFGEDIDNLLYCRMILQINDPLLYLLLDVVHMDLYVFGSLMLKQVLQDLDVTLIVTMEDYWLWKGEAKLSQNILKRNILSSNINNSSILNLR